MESLWLTTRVHRCARSVKVARTITNLAGSDRIETVHLAGSDGIQTVHLAEAIQYRPRRQS
jgi:predicted ATPase with chaperone activity